MYKAFSFDPSWVARSNRFKYVTGSYRPTLNSLIVPIEYNIVDFNITLIGLESLLINIYFWGFDQLGDKMLRRIL